MTKSQAEMLEYLKTAILKHDGLNRPDEYCYGCFEVKEHKYFVSLVTVVGRKDWSEYTMTIFGVRRHIIIGKRGGMKLMNAKDGKVTGMDVVWRQTN